MNIKSITLLSEDEFYKCEAHIPKVNCQIWWLRTPYYLAHRACAVFVNSYVGNTPVSSSAVGVRPALILENSSFTVGQKLVVLGCSWTVILVKEEEALALCDEVIAQRCFDEDSNEFGTSGVYRFLESWLKNLQENPTSVKYSYTIKTGNNSFSGFVVVPVDATDNDIKIAIIDALEDVSYKKLE